MRKFNAAGPCDPKKHYCLHRTKLIEKGMEKIHDSRFFTIWAPRQAGKTTYFHQLVEEVKKTETEYLPLWISFERYEDNTKEEFYSFHNVLNHLKNAERN